MTGLFSTAYFPPIQYVATIFKHTELLIEAKETFPKQTYRNRMEIMTAGGIRTLTVPVIRNNHSRTDEVRIDYKERWNIIHLRTLEAAYSASPYYLYYKDDIEALLTPHYNQLLDLNMVILERLIKWLKITATTALTTDYEPTPGYNDYRTLYSPKKPLPAENYPKYYQVFADRQPFAHNLSILDLLMNMGPESTNYLRSLPSTATANSDKNNNL